MNKLSLGFTSFLSSTSIAIYCGFTGWLMLNGNKIFGSTPSFMGPVAFLLLFVASASLCSFLLLGYPFYLFWEKKQTTKAMLGVAYSIVWLVVYAVITLALLSASSSGRLQF